MVIPYVYLAYAGSLGELAVFIRGCLNISDKNPSGKEQHRDGLNIGGGEYY